MEDGHRPIQRKSFPVARHIVTFVGDYTRKVLLVLCFTKSFKVEFYERSDDNVQFDDAEQDFTNAQLKNSEEIRRSECLAANLQASIDMSYDPPTFKDSLNSPEASDELWKSK